MIRNCMRALGFVVIAVVIIGVAGFNYLYFRKPATAPPSAVRVEITPARLARGKYLFTLADCGGGGSLHRFLLVWAPGGGHGGAPGKILSPQMWSAGGVGA